MIRAKVLGPTYSKRLSKPDLKATFSDVCLVKTELKSNDLRIQVFVLQKPYIVYMCIEIHEMNITSIKIKQGQNPSKRTKTYNSQPRTKPVETNCKNTYFCTYRDKNAFSRKLKDRFSPPLLQCCLRCTLELL